MATGLLSNGTCFETSLEASDNYYSHLAPFTWLDPVTGSIDSVIYVFNSVSQVWQRSSTVAGVVTVTPLGIYPNLPFCTSPSESFQDGMDIGSVIVGLVVLAWSVIQLKRLFR
jgi:hypothetical protein